MLLTLGLAFAVAPATAHSQSGSLDYVTQSEAQIVLDPVEPFLTGNCLRFGGVIFHEGDGCLLGNPRKDISEIHDPSVMSTNADGVPTSEMKITIEDDTGTNVFGTVDVRAGQNTWDNAQDFCGTFDTKDHDLDYTFPAASAPDYSGGESNWVIVWVGGPVQQAVSAGTVVEPTCDLVSTGGTTGQVSLTLYGH